MKAKIVEAETVVTVSYPYRLNERVGLAGVVGKKYFMDYKHNNEMTLLFRLEKFEQRNDW
jgi:hypothetical protein